MIEKSYTVLCPFGGSGGGARGFLAAETRLLGHVGRFRCLGSIDFDREACDDFERLTGSPTLCADVQQLTVADVRAFAGERRPDVVFMSPPCKGSSRLISKAKSATPKYAAMNQLALVWTRLMLGAWGDDPPPLVLLENVPGLPTRAGAMLRELRSMLRAAGYVFHAGTHDCGEVGGLAQHRERYLLVARHPKKCGALLYQPPKRRVRACGEVLADLPVPATPAAAAWGELHTLPKIQWRNWIRLALIPAGGDWRDLEGVLAEGQARREVFRRHAVAEWVKPIEAVTGPGGHTVGAVADPRWHNGTWGVQPWTEPAPAITGGADGPSRGRFSVADPRATGAFSNVDRVRSWDEPVGTITSSPAPSSGRPAVADPRVDALRVPVGFDAAYGVLRWDAPARTVAGTTATGCGAYAVSDPRDRAGVEARVLTIDEALALDLSPTKAPPFVPVIVAADGTWHRPLTLLELAVLQSYPARIDGEPIRFSGKRTQVAEHIGNSVPEGAARAIGERMLVALITSALGGFALSGDLPVWVVPDEAQEATA